MDHKEFDGAYQEIERYFCNVSHELKSPLQEIELYAKVIEEDSGALLPDQSRKDLQAIRKICRNTLDMVQLFMKYANTRSRAISLEVIPMKPLIMECVELMTRPLTGRRIQVTVEELPNVIGDRFLFQQMITNILSNCIKFTESKGEARIQIYSYEEAEMTNYCFKDNGIGFDIKYAARIFELFERMHAESDVEGNGIGLPLVKSIVDRFEGDVEITAVENEGCTVTVKLPNKMVISLEKEQQMRRDKDSQITIGVLGATSGEYANITPCRKYAYELAVEEINASGGILGKTLQMKYRDFASDISRVPQLAWELAEVEQVDVMMDGFLSSARELIREVIDQKKIPYFFNALYEGGLADHYTFCVSAAPEQNVYPMLDYLFRSHGKNCYIIAADYNYGVLTAECAKDYVEKNGGTVVGVEYFSALKNDFDRTIDNIKKADPDLLLSFCVSTNQNLFYEQWYEKGIPGIPVVSTIGVGLSYLHKLTPAPVMENTYFMSSYVEELRTPAAEAFSRKLRERHPEVPYIEFDAETAYTAVYFYKKAVELANSTDPEKVIAALESGQVSFDGPGGRVTMRGEDHQTIRDERLFRVNGSHQIELIAEYAALQSDFVEKAILQETGVAGGLKELGLNAPNAQYNMMFRRIL